MSKVVIFCFLFLPYVCAVSINNEKDFIRYRSKSRDYISDFINRYDDWCKLTDPQSEDYHKMVSQKQDSCKLAYKTEIENADLKKNKHFIVRDIYLMAKEQKSNDLVGYVLYNLVAKNASPLRFEKTLPEAIDCYSFENVEHRQLIEHIANFFYLDQSEYCCGSYEQFSQKYLDDLHKKLRFGEQASTNFLASHETLEDVCKKDSQVLEECNITHEQIADVLSNIKKLYDKARKISNPKDQFYNEEKAKNYEEKLALLSDEAKESRAFDGFTYYDEAKVKNTSPMVINYRERDYLVARHSYWGIQNCLFDSGLRGGEHSFDMRNTIGGGDDYTIYDLSNNPCYDPTSLEKTSALWFNDLLIHLIRDHHFFEGSTYHRVEPKKVIDFFNIQPNTKYALKMYEAKEWQKKNGSMTIMSPVSVGVETIIEVDDKKSNKLSIKIQQINEKEKSITVYHQEHPEFPLIIQLGKMMENQLIFELTTIKLVKANG